MIAVIEMLDIKVSHVTTDPLGRFVILICTLDVTPFTLVNEYAQNEGQIKFLKKVLAKVCSLCKGNFC